MARASFSARPPRYSGAKWSQTAGKEDYKIPDGFPLGYFSASEGLAAHVAGSKTR